MKGKRTAAVVLAVLVLVAVLVASAVPSMADGSWQTETVDNAADLGQYTSLALDSSGNPRISYWDGTNSDLKYASKNGTVWTKETVDSTGNVGEYTSLALNSSGNPRISYYDRSNSDLKYASKNGTVWTKETVDSTGSVGSFPSLALDFSGNPRISYHDATNGYLKYAYKDGTGWHAEIADNTGDMGYYTSIALNSTGDPRISYFDNTNWDLKYASKNGTTWTKETVDSTGMVGEETSLKLDSSGSPRISYYDLTNGDLKYASKNGTVWTKETVDSTGNAGDSSSLALNSSGGPRISYYDGTNSDLKYASKNGTTWTKETVESTGNVGAYTSLALNSSGGPRISYYDGTAVGLKYDAFIPTPTITTITPSSGTQGTTVSITDLKGTGFNGTPTVKLKKMGQTDIAATNVSVVSPTKITCKFNLANAPLGAWNVYVQNPDTQSATKANAFTVNSASATWYLAEGTTAWGFSTYISIQNPNSSAVNAKVTYMPKGASNVQETITLPANSQTTLTNDHLIQKMGGTYDFSTRVEATDRTKSIAVDRTMEWTGPGASAPEGHSSVGVTSPANTWYLPEGSTNWNFETWLLIQNPNGAEASVDVTYMIEGKGPTTVNHKVPANSRESYSMQTDIGAADASIKVVSDRPVIPERAMYRYNRREGHDSIGTTQPSSTYYLAEGAVGYDSGYTTYILVQNPQTTQTDVTVTYLTGTGQVAGPTFTMSANSRKTVKVNDSLPPNTDVSTSVQGSQPIIAERAMYWNSPAGEACHDSIGMSHPAGVFYFPDGQTSEGRETWTLVQNPNPGSVTVKVSYLPAGGGTPVSFTDEIPANSRKTYNMADKLPSGRASIMVQCLTEGYAPVMCERAMYWDSRAAGTDTIGGSE